MTVLPRNLCSIPGKGEFFRPSVCPSRLPPPEGPSLHTGGEIKTEWIYVVSQKSNETDFLLTMNFILFTNEGYPLLNSSIGQLHGDGGVVSIVRSSAGRLLLEYLSARRLRSSGYYPKYKNGALSSSF